MLEWYWSFIGVRVDTVTTLKATFKRLSLNLIKQQDLIFPMQNYLFKLYSCGGFYCTKYIKLFFHVIQRAHITANYLPIKETIMLMLYENIMNTEFNVAAISNTAKWIKCIVIRILQHNFQPIFNLVTLIYL